MSIELTMKPHTMTYEQALMTFKKEVNRKYPPEMIGNNNKSSRINEVNIRGPGGRSSGRECGHGGG